MLLKPFSMMKAATGGGGGVPESIFGATVPGEGYGPEYTNYTMGNIVRFAVNGSVTHLRFYRNGNSPYTTHTLRLYQMTSGSTGTLLSSVTGATAAAGDWNDVELSSPESVTSGTLYLCAVDLEDDGTNGVYYNSVADIGTNGLESGNVEFPTTSEIQAVYGGAQGNGRYVGSINTFPTSNYNNEGYGVDVIFEAS